MWLSAGLSFLAGQVLFFLAYSGWIQDQGFWFSFSIGMIVTAVQSIIFTIFMYADGPIQRWRARLAVALSAVAGLTIPWGTYALTEWLPFQHFLGVILLVALGPMIGAKLIRLALIRAK